MRAVDITAPFIVTRTAPGRFALTADVALPEDAGEAMGLTAVIQAVDGSVGYWALRHSSDRPDFHHDGSFAAEI